MRLAAITLFLLASTLAEAAKIKGHLVPIRPNFDTRPGVTDAKEFAKACEEKLFDRPDWVIRYFEVVEYPSATTGISLCRQGDGRYWLSLRQARPDIRTLPNFKAALRSVRVKKYDVEMPSAPAEEFVRLWNKFLSETKPRPTNPGVIEIHAPEMILYAKGVGGRILAGKLPPDAEDFSVFVRFYNLVSHLIDLKDPPASHSQALARKIEIEARSLRATLRQP